MLIPSRISRDSPPGEKVIFRAFQDDPNCDNWTILHSLKLSDHIKNTSGEIDFLVIIPHMGVLVIEVKSHSKVSYDEKNGWKLGNEYKDPFKQVSEAKYSLIRKLKISNLNFNLPVISCVWFTHINFSVKSTEWHEWDYLDKNDREYKISRIIIDNFKKQLSFLSKKLTFNHNEVLNTDLKIEQLKGILRPNFSLIADTGYNKRSSGLSLKIATEKQLEILNSINNNDRILIDGFAGTGKTSLAIESARRKFIDDKNSKVALFCFNKLFGIYLTQLCRNFNEQFICDRFMHWLYSICVKLKLIDESDFKRMDFWDKCLQENVLTKIKYHFGDNGWLDFLIIDESQDLLNIYNLKIFDAILKGGLKNGKWLILGDFNYQNIFNRDLDIHAYFDNNNINCVNYELTNNCRNTPEVGRFLKKISNYDPLYSSYMRPPNGVHPDIIEYQDSISLKKSLSLIITKCLNMGYLKKDIVLLSPKKRNRRIMWF